MQDCKLSIFDSFYEGGSNDAEPLVSIKLDSLSKMSAGQVKAW